MNKFFLTFFFLFFPLVLFAQWDDCDGGCSYPGDCSSYIDTNMDGSCDYSQEKPVVSEVSEPVIHPVEELLEVDEENGSEPNLLVSKEQVKKETEQKKNLNQKTKKRYNIIPLVFLLVVFYSFTWFLAKKKKIEMLTHRKFWNVVLLVSFLLSGISGLLLVARINYGWMMIESFNLLKMHVETGIVMAIVTFFHVAWHWKYFFSILRKKKM